MCALCVCAKCVCLVCVLSVCVCVCVCARASLSVFCLSCVRVRPTIRRPLHFMSALVVRMWTATKTKQHSNTTTLRTGPNAKSKPIWSLELVTRARTRHVRARARVCFRARIVCVCVCVCEAHCAWVARECKWSRRSLQRRRPRGQCSAGRVRACGPRAGSKTGACEQASQ